MNSETGNKILNYLKSNDFDSYIPLDFIDSYNNELINISTEAEEMFESIAKEIVKAKYMINITFFVWYCDCDPCEVICKALNIAINNFVPTEKIPKLQINFLISESQFLQNSIANELFKTCEKYNLITDKSEIRLYLKLYYGLGSYHFKYITVDDNTVFITGCSVQRLFNWKSEKDTNWCDISIIFKGSVTLSFLQHFKFILSNDVKQLNCFDNKEYNNLDLKTSLKRTLYSSFGNVSSCELCKPFEDVNFNFNFDSNSIKSLKKSQLECIECNTNTKIPILTLSKPEMGELVCNYERLELAYNNVANQSILASLILATEEIKIITPTLNDDTIWFTLNEILHTTEVNILILTNYNFNYYTQENFENGTSVSKLYYLVNCCEKCIECYDNNRLQIRLFSYDGENVVNDHEKHANHAKSIFIDNKISIVGSQNLDRQSMLSSAELNVLIDDRNITEQIQNKVFKEQWERSIPYEFVYL